MKSTVEFYVVILVGGWRRLICVWLVALALPTVAFAETPAQVDQLAQQWLDIERQANHLQSDWKIRRPVLSQRLILLKAERRELQALLKEGRVSDDVDSRRRKLLAEQAELEQQQTQLSRFMIQLNAALEGVVPRLPPTLATIWQDEKSTLSDGAETSAQLQVALAQLGHLADFDKRVSVHEGRVTTADGETILVKQLYLGAGLAWFVSRDGQQVGWGQASESRWRWHFDDSVGAAEVSKAIAMFEKRETAELVHLPIRLAVQRHELNTGVVEGRENDASTEGIEP